MYKLDSQHNVGYICKEKKYVFAKVLNPQITIKAGSERCHVCGRSANLTNYLRLQICGTATFANVICTSAAMQKPVKAVRQRPRDRAVATPECR
jgi:hypothetical protein